MAAAPIKTTTTELPESRVRVEAQVPPEEVQRTVERTARQLGRDLRIPGFRKGKVPPPVVIKRIGRTAVLDEAVREGLTRWYIAALDDSGIAPVGDPTLDMGELPDEGQPLTFSIEIGVRPKAQLGQYKGLEVGRREPEADDAAVDAEVEALRERLARVETVDRAAGSGDFIVMDFVGSIDGEEFEGGSGRDQMIELGKGMLVPGFEEQLEGASAGDERTVEIDFPDDYGAEHLAGKHASFAVTVKEVKAKELPELDDDFALEAAGFDTLAELREDVANRLRETDERRIAAEFREAVLDAAVAEATVEVPEPLVEARAQEMWDRMLHSLGHQGITKEVYLQISGKSEEELLAESRPQAKEQLAREAVVAAVIEAEGVEVADEALLEAVEPIAEQEGVKPKKALERLRSQGRLDALRDELAQRRAIELLAEEAKPISIEQAKAKGKLWTPEKESGAEGAPELWTPGG